MLKYIASNFYFNSHLSFFFFSAVLEPVSPSNFNKYSEPLRNWLTDLIQTLERQYPTPFDQICYKIMSGTTATNHRKQLNKILKNTLVYKGKFELIENLCHSNEELRKQAIHCLKKGFQSFKETDKEIIRNLLVERLNNDNVKIVKKTLEIIKENKNILTDVVLKDVLLNLARKCRYGNMEKISDQILLNLIHLPEAALDWNIFMAIFPYLMPKSQQDFDKHKSTLSLYISKHKILKNAQHSLNQLTDFDDFSNGVLGALQTKHEDDDNVWTLINALSNVPKSKRDCLHKYIAAVTITTLLPEKTQLDISKLIIEILATYTETDTDTNTHTNTETETETVHDKFIKQNATIVENIEACFNNKMPVNGFRRCVENLILKTRIPPHSGKLDLLKENNAYLICISNMIFRDGVNNNYLGCFNLLHHICGPTETEKVEFLLNICLSDHDKLLEITKIESLKLVVNLLQKVNVNDKDNVNVYVNIIDRATLIETTSFVVPYLLPLLANSRDTIRKLSLTIIKNLITIQTKTKNNTYSCLLDAVQRHAEEITMDHDQIPLVLFNILAPENTKGKKQVRELNCVRNTLFQIIGELNDPSPVYLKAGLLTVLNLINSVEIFENVSVTAVHILKDNPSELTFNESVVVTKILSRIERSVANKILLDTKLCQLILFALKNEQTELTGIGKKMCPALWTLTQLDKEDMFRYLNEDVVKQLLSTIVDICTFAKNSDILPASLRIFKHMELDVQQILDHLVAMREVRSPKFDEKTKKRRVSVVPTIDILDTPEWKKGITILEFIQDKKRIKNVHLLLPVMFDLLKKCLDFDEQVSVEYPKQLILSLILHCCQKIDERNHPLPENVFNMELVVQCIRASQNPQTHHHALLVLAHAAHLIPTQVLHHIMAIFTFMGSSVLRHDDAYSFQIISKIIDTVVPILMENSTAERSDTNTNTNTNTTVCKVLRVFVDAILDVPEHRRLPLYRQLLDRIDAKENLSTFLLLIFESHVMHGAANQDQKTAGGEFKGITSPKRLDIAANLSRLFPPQTVIYSCIKLFKYLKELPDEKEDAMDVDQEGEETTTFNIATHTPKQFRHYKYTLLTFVSSLLASHEFVNQIARVADEDLPELEALYKEAIIQILTYVQRIQKIAEKNADGPQAHYWKVVLHHSYDALDCINALLTPQMFLLVFKGLMVHNIPTIRRRALELLNNKLQHNSTFFFNDCETAEIYALIPPIFSILETLKNAVDDPEQELIVQTALLSLKLLTKSLAQQDPNKFVKILDFIALLMKSEKVHSNVQASVVLCLAELVAVLRAHAIPNLNNFMPALIKILKVQTRQRDSPGSLLLLSVITAIDKILDTLPLFISPYLQKLLFKLAILMSQFGSTNAAEEAKLEQKLAQIKQKIGTMIPSRVLIPAVATCYQELTAKKKYAAINGLMDILGEHLTNSGTPAEINGNLSELTNFFMNALQFRAENGNSPHIGIEETNEIERHIVKCLTILILKLSEGNFRPLYYKLYDWATRDQETKSERIITFYGLSADMARSLKGLFILFAGHFLNNAAQLLDQCNTIKTDELYFETADKNRLLLENLLKTLNTVFLYDSQKFINKDRFHVLMQPIVDQLENTFGGFEELKQRNEQLLTPCLIHFALATADDSLWKQLNYQILLKMRHTSPEIRLVALHCLSELVKKLGEDFLPFLPETIPFLAELLEDEEETVEKACKKAVQEMERVLGEPLQKYF